MNIIFKVIRNSYPIFTKNITSIFAFAAQPALDKAVVENITNTKSTLPRLSQRCEIQLYYY